MIYLLLAVLSSCFVSVIMRLSTHRVKNNMGMLAMNYLIALCLSVATGGTGFAAAAQAGFATAVALGIVNGILYMVSFVSFQNNVGKNGVVLSSVFMKLGILVPVLMSICFFGESPSLIQIAGFVLAVAAIIIINSGAEKGRAGFNMGLVVLLLLSGTADAMIKVFEQFGNVVHTGAFFTLTFVVAHLMCVVQIVRKKQKIGRSEVLFGCLIGIPNFMSARFLLLSLQNMPAVIVYPSYSVATVLLVSLVGVAAFSERLMKKQWFALLLILAALVLLNI